MKERAGDFSDWRDANGNLIPIYDPATIQVLPDGTVTKQPFPGNIIPANRITDIAKGYLQYLPTPTNDGTLNNYLVPTAIPDSILGDSNYFFGRFDTYVGQNDHVAVSLWFQRAKVKYYSELPHELATETTSNPQNSSVHRLNWDHTFGSNLLNHLTFGYLNRNEGYGCVNTDAVDKLPQDPGRRLEQRPVADDVQRRLRHVRLRRQPRAGQHHDPSDVRPQRPRHLHQGQPHDQDRRRVPQHRRERPQPDERAGHVQLRPRGHRPPGRHQRQPDRELPARRGGQRQHGRAHGVERLPAPARLDLPRRRHLERHQQADAELRPALGLLLALDREVRPPRVLRPQRCQPVGRRPPRQSRLRGHQLGRGELRRALPREELVRRLGPAPRRHLRAQHQDPHPRRVGPLLRPRVLPRVGRRHGPGRLQQQRELRQQPRRRPARLLHPERLPPELHPAAVHHRGLPQRLEPHVPPPRRQRAGARAAVEPDDRPRDLPGLHARCRLRRQPRHPRRRPRTTR